MVLFGSLLDQFVSSFDLVTSNGLSIFQFDSLRVIDGFNELGTVVLSSISENPRSRFMLELMLLLC